MKHIEALAYHLDINKNDINLLSVEDDIFKYKYDGKEYYVTYKKTKNTHNWLVFDYNIGKYYRYMFIEKEEI